MRSALLPLLAAEALLNGALPAAAQETGPAHSQQPAMQGLPQGQPGAMENVPERQGQTRAARAAAQGGASEHRSVHVLSPEQRAGLQRAITGSDIHRADRVNYSLSVGTRIPESLRIYDVPESIAAVLPQFRGFKYIVVQSELIIVDPGTLEIAAVLPV